jgi:hypothetical protein
MGYRLKVQIKIRDENREFLMRAIKYHTQLFIRSEIKGVYPSLLRGSVSFNFKFGFSGKV